MASLTFSQIEFADVKLAKLVRAVEIAVKLCECNCKPQAVAVALSNALNDFHQPQRKPVKGAFQHGNHAA